MGYLDTKEHKDWSKLVRERDAGCIICQEQKTAAHHLFPKENILLRSDPKNGVALCFKHHMRFGYGLSPHSHGSGLFYLWLMRNRPDIIKWMDDNYEV